MKQTIRNVLKTLGYAILGGFIGIALPNLLGFQVQWVDKTKNQINKDYLSFDQVCELTTQYSFDDHYNRIDKPIIKKDVFIRGYYTSASTLATLSDSSHPEQAADIEISDKGRVSSIESGFFNTKNEIILTVHPNYQKQTCEVSYYYGPNNEMRKKGIISEDFLGKLINKPVKHEL